MYILTLYLILWHFHIQKWNILLNFQIWNFTKFTRIVIGFDKIFPLLKLVRCIKVLCFCMELYFCWIERTQYGNKSFFHFKNTELFLNIKYTYSYKNRETVYSRHISISNGCHCDHSPPKCVWDGFEEWIFTACFGKVYRRREEHHTWNYMKSWWKWTKFLFNQFRKSLLFYIYHMFLWFILEIFSDK